MKIAAVVPEQPIIEAERFTLRPVRISDSGLMAMYAGDERVAKTTSSIPHPLPPGSIEAYVARAMAPEPAEIIWVMDGTAAELSEVLGVISLKPMDRNQSEIGYWVAPVLWNSGIASQAVRMLVEANPLKNETMFATVFQDNPASARVLTNVGFEYLGDAEQFSVARDAKVATWTYLKRLG
ncbi:GNAT family N-acetyltransferase [Candidatus Halocynthiibacter alkanivorans]|jgi:RimJ/RimL family protein N-acetyltransferase|uniref:GNAT family N-acetyltransferase n=1 Tax=Candidatus Halocynthiibacter alkanivorans TaxID=2267619 RepID=UPI000DF1A935|nr:GNAT family N-acetyltransferase [Candidatus Halocynthiibacter alkanivorans]